ncbi:hypothetical protein BU15DRAFT_67187 [Melanogaster broomeanus]|nr:hypothetical protein BU15DRAFT_67187 [Melanogaster broomeanus]
MYTSRGSTTQSCGNAVTFCQDLWAPVRPSPSVVSLGNVMGMDYPRGSRIQVWVKLNFFLNTTRRATKLTEKAKAALLDCSSLSKMRKNDVTTGAETAEKHTKKARAMDTPGSSNNNSSVAVLSSPSTSSVATGQRIIVMRTAEEDASVINLSSGGEGNGEAKSSPEAETAEEELTHLMKEWTSPIYAFFDLMPWILMIDGWRVHEFKCSARGCKGCWGPEVLPAADSAKDADEALSLNSGSSDTLHAGGTTRDPTFLYGSFRELDHNLGDNLDFNDTSGSTLAIPDSDDGLYSMFHPISLEDVSSLITEGSKAPAISILIHVSLHLHPSYYLHLHRASRPHRFSVLQRSYLNPQDYIQASQLPHEPAGMYNCHPGCEMPPLPKDLSNYPSPPQPSYGITFPGADDSDVDRTLCLSAPSTSNPVLRSHDSHPPESVNRGSHSAPETAPAVTKTPSKQRSFSNALNIKLTRSPSISSMKDKEHSPSNSKTSSFPLSSGSMQSFGQQLRKSRSRDHALSPPAPNAPWLPVHPDGMASAASLVSMSSVGSTRAPKSAAIPSAKTPDRERGISSRPGTGSSGSRNATALSASQNVLINPASSNRVKTGSSPNKDPSRHLPATPGLTQKKSSVLSIGLPSLLQSGSRRSLYGDKSDSGTGNGIRDGLHPRDAEKEGSE